jgi:hypothetical protein
MLETSFLILSLVFLLLVGFSIPLFLQMWRATKNMATALESLNKGLPGILKNLEEITSNISRATSLLEKEMESLSLLGNKIRAIMAMGENVERILHLGVKRPVWEALRNARGLLKGVRAFFDVLQAKQEPHQGDRPCPR